MKKLTDAQIKQITDAAVRELGQSASKEKVAQIVSQVVKEIERGAPTIALSGSESSSSGRIIVTSYGKNSPGILYNITKVLHDTHCDVLDVSQKILQEFFTLIMIVDITTSKEDFYSIKTKLNDASDKIGVQIHVQHEDIFKSMHRI